ncbi:MAG TPA: helix-turn-helix transcriptional regulator [Myxococcota bacterium]|nr:helix-turn-helix transcriptional regulator [Myxococcota bacterium]
MSSPRQSRDEAAIRVRGMAVNYPHGHALPLHDHDWAQLIYASQGVMSVHTEAGAWVVPAHRAVWVPAGVRHRIAMSGAVAMRTLYLDPSLACAAPAHCTVVNVSPLLRELVLRAVEIAPLYETEPAHARLIGVLVDELESLRVVPLRVPAPRDPRARRAAEWLRSHPGDGAVLERVARSAGASKRTLERLFLRETGMSLGAWREQMRLMRSLELLARGDSVTEVALSVGYASTSAFIARFRRVLGTTPGRYYANESSGLHASM